MPVSERQDGATTQIQRLRFVGVNWDDYDAALFDLDGVGAGRLRAAGADLIVHDLAEVISR